MRVFGRFSFPTRFQRVNLCEFKNFCVAPPCARALPLCSPPRVGTPTISRLSQCVDFQVQFVDINHVVRAVASAAEPDVLFRLYIVWRTLFESPVSSFFIFGGTFRPPSTHRLHILTPPPGMSSGLLNLHILRGLYYIYSGWVAAGRWLTQTPSGPLGRSSGRSEFYFLTRSRSPFCVVASVAFFAKFFFQNTIAFIQ